MARQAPVFVIVLLVLLAVSSTWRLTALASEVSGKTKEAEKEEQEEEAVMPEGLCGYKSKTYSGQCLSRRGCEYQCKVVEHAQAGACHFHHIQRHCYCYHYC